MAENKQNNEEVVDLDNMSDEDFIAYMNKFQYENENFTLENSDSESVNQEPVANTGSEEVKESNDNIDVDDDSQSEDQNIDTEQEVEKSENDDENIEVETSTGDENQQEEIETENTEVKTDDNDLQKQLKELKQFREAFNKKVVIDGVELPAISDPDKLIEMQKRFVEYEKKLNNYEKNRSVYETLSETGLLEDKEKLALLLDVAKGDQDAIKTILKQNNLNPLELDIDEFDGKKVDPNEYFASPIELKFKDMVEESRDLGIEDKLSKDVLSTWDNDAIAQLLQDEQSKHTLLEHLRTGSFYKVKEKIIDNMRTDFTGDFKSKNAFEQYAIASHQLAEELNKQQQQQEPVPVVDNVEVPAEKPAKKAPVVDTKKEEDRLAKAKKASKSSNTTNSETAKGGSKLEDLNDEDFLKAMYSMI